MAIEKVNNDALSDILERIVQQKGEDFIIRDEMFLAKVNKIIFLAKVNKIIEEIRTHIWHSGDRSNKKINYTTTI